MIFDNWGITEKSAYEIAEKALTDINNGGKGVVDKLYDLITKPFKEQVYQHIITVLLQVALM